MNLQLEHEYLKIQLIESQMQILKYQHKEVSAEIKRLEYETKANVTNHESLPEIS